MNKKLNARITLRPMIEHESNNTKKRSILMRTSQRKQIPYLIKQQFNEGPFRCIHFTPQNSTNLPKNSVHFVQILLLLWTSLASFHRHPSLLIYLSLCVAYTHLARFIWVFCYVAIMKYFSSLYPCFQMNTSSFFSWKIIQLDKWCLFSYLRARTFIVNKI